MPCVLNNVIIALRLERRKNNYAVQFVSFYRVWRTHSKVNIIVYLELFRQMLCCKALSLNYCSNPRSYQ